MLLLGTLLPCYLTDHLLSAPKQPIELSCATSEQPLAILHLESSEPASSWQFLPSTWSTLAYCFWLSRIQPRAPLSCEASLTPAGQSCMTMPFPLCCLHGLAPFAPLDVILLYSTVCWLASLAPFLVSSLGVEAVPNLSLHCQGSQST